MYSKDHPTVKWFFDSFNSRESSGGPTILEKQRLKDLSLELGAADAGFIEVDRPATATWKGAILEALPTTKTVAALAFRFNREPLRTVFHSITSMEFRHTWDMANRCARNLVTALGEMDVPALNLSAGFPYEADRWPGVMHFVSDKPIAVEAGLGRMGWNRMVIHPRFGNGIVLATVLIGAELGSYDGPMEFNPCIECKLCVSVCPTGAIGADGNFDFVPCYVHNYRERAGNFVDWVKHLVESKNFEEYRTQVSDAETVSMWQNLSICPQTRCDRCVGVCPAGEENIGEFLLDRKGYVQRIVKKFKEKKEIIYVIPGSDAEARVTGKFPNKTPKRVTPLER
ncbi:MAG: 4Fe-4S binding protein [Pseudomonadota bacterium]